jgi:flagellar biosynthesis/type III secretory pathway protein FliH
VGRATFSGTLRTQVLPFFERRGGVMTPTDTPSMDPPPGMEPLAPPLPPPIPQPGPEFAARLARAIADLRRSSERLAEQATADALEMALLIARRIIEAELSTGPAPLIGLIRSAIGRLGESRKVQVRLCPSDAEAVEAAGAADGDDGALAGMTLARVEIRADATLSPGDCIVDGEHGTVDGRLSTRLDEVRRILARALGDGEGGAR